MWFPSAIFRPPRLLEERLLRHLAAAETGKVVQSSGYFARTSSSKEGIKWIGGAKDGE